MRIILVLLTVLFLPALAFGEEPRKELRCDSECIKRVRRVPTSRIFNLGVVNTPEPEEKFLEKKKKAGGNGEKKCFGFGTAAAFVGAGATAYGAIEKKDPVAGVGIFVNMTALIFGEERWECKVASVVLGGLVGWGAAEISGDDGSASVATASNDGPGPQPQN